MFSGSSPGNNSMKLRRNVAARMDVAPDPENVGVFRGKGLVLSADDRMTWCRPVESV